MSPRLGHARPLAVAGALAIVYVVWGSTYLGIAYAIETLPPLLMCAARFLVAGAILYGLSGLRGGLGRPTRSEWTGAVVTGGLLLGVGNAGVAWAQQSVPTGIAAIVVASVAIWIVVLDRLLFGRRLTRVATLGIALGFSGVILLVGPVGGGIDRTGAAVLVCANVGWAVGSLVTRGARLHPHPLRAASTQMLAAGALLVVAGIAAGELGDVHPSEVSLRSLAGVAYLVVFGSIVAFSAYTWLLRVAPISTVATYAYVNPVIAVLLGWLALGEEVTGRMLVAGTVVLLAVALIVSAGQAAQPESPRATARALRRSAGRLRAALATRGR